MDNSPQNSSWPKYPVGPGEAIFCLGVIAINYAELCSVFEYIFSEIFLLDIDGGRSIVNKIGQNNAHALASQRLKSENNKVYNADLIEHFLEGRRRATDNRGLILHSELSYLVQDKAFFVKPSKKTGDMNGIIRHVSELRDFADAIKAFSIFGRAIINCNGWPAFSQLMENAPAVSPFSRPQKPTLPEVFNFQTGPIYL